MSTVLEITSTTLGRVSVGQRLWFWFCEAVPAEEQLILTSLLDDPDMSRLFGLVERSEAPLGARSVRGVVSVLPEGQLLFGGVGAREDLLRSLAAWTSSVSTPEARVLKNAIVSDLTPDGVVAASFEDDALWTHLSAPVLPGTPQAAAQRLSELSLGEKVSFWCTDQACNGAPAFVVAGRANDPESRLSLVSQIRGLRGSGKELYGAISPLADGRCLLATERPIDSGKRLVERLLDAHPHTLARLYACDLVHYSDAGFITTARVDSPPSLGRLVTALSSLAPERKVWFSFTDRYGPLDEAALFVADDPESLKLDAAHAREHGREIHGELRVSAQERVTFVAKQSFDGFVPMLADWVARYRVAYPGLARLHDARLVVVDATGKIVSRHRDEAAWA